MRLALAWACPTFLLGDYDNIATSGRDIGLTAAKFQNINAVSRLVHGFVCEGLSPEECKKVAVPNITWTDPEQQPPSRAPSQTYRYDVPGTDKFWNQYLKQTFLAHASQTAFENLHVNCMPKKCAKQLKACHGVQPCNRRLLRMETNRTDNGIDAVYGTEGPPPHHRDKPLFWAELSAEEHDVFSCALSACAEPRLAIVKAVSDNSMRAADTEQAYFAKRLGTDSGQEQTLDGYHKIAALGCAGLLPILDTNAAFEWNGKTTHDAVVMPNMDGTARGWARRHSVAERQQCAPALARSLTQAVTCLHHAGWVHNDLISRSVLYAEDAGSLVEEAMTLRSN